MVPVEIAKVIKDRRFFGYRESQTEDESLVGPQATKRETPGQHTARS